MTSAQLRTIEGIFRAALDQQPEQLSAFLDVACEGDENSVVTLKRFWLHGKKQPTS
jgi:hypothetical protein